MSCESCTHYLGERYCSERVVSLVLTLQGESQLVPERVEAGCSRKNAPTQPLYATAQEIEEAAAPWKIQITPPQTLGRIPKAPTPLVQEEGPRRRRIKVSELPMLFPQDSGPEEGESLP